MPKQLRNIYMRPPICLFLSVLFISALFLIGELIHFRTASSIVDPDTRANSAKILLTLSELEFCSEPWSSSIKQFQLNEAFLLNFDKAVYQEESEKVFSRHIRLSLMYDYAPLKGIQSLFARMRGVHLGFTGGNALHKINVSLLVPKIDDNQTPCLGSRCKQRVFDSCLLLSAPIKLLPHFDRQLSCTRQQLKQMNSPDSAQLMWQNRHRIMDSHLCNGHSLWRPKFSEDRAPILPVLSQDDVDLISKRIGFIICLILIIISTISVTLVCMPTLDFRYTPLLSEQTDSNEYIPGDADLKDVFTD